MGVRNFLTRSLARTVDDIQLTGEIVRKVVSEGIEEYRVRRAEKSGLSEPNVRYELEIYVDWTVRPKDVSARPYQ